MLEVPERRKYLASKFVTGFAAGALLSFGLCTAGVSEGDRWWGHLSQLFAPCFFICLVGLVISAIWLSVSKRGPGR